MNRRNKIIIISLILIALVCAGLWWYVQEPTAYNIRDNALNKLEDVKTYSLEMNLAMSDEQSDIKVKMEGDVDLESKKMHATMVVGGGATEIPADMYVVNNTVYINMFGRWAKQNILRESFYKEDQLKNQIELLKDANVTYYGTNSTDKPYTEDVDGQECYVLNVKPSTEKMLNYLEGQIIEHGGLVEFEKEKKNIKGVSIKEWIAKSDMLPRKIVISSEFEDTKVHIAMKFYIYNEKLSIKLPQEAKEAKEISQMSEQI